MDKLPDELLLVIIKKIAVFEVRDLINIKEKSRCHRQLVDKKAAFKLFPTNYLRFLADDSPSAAKNRFMQRLAYSGHASICVILVDSLLLQPQPDLETIKNILAKVVRRKCDGAKYLDIMLEVLATGGFSEEKVFSTFYDLFSDKQLANYRRSIMNLDGLHFAQEDLELRSMPFGLEYKFTCSSTIACE